MNVRIETYDGVGVAVLRDFVLVSWIAPSTEDRVRWCFQQAERARLGNPRGVLVCQLVAPSSTPPDAPTRKIAHQRMAANGDLIRRMVTVPLGDDLWISLVRAIMRAVFVVSGHAKTHFVAATEDAALDLLLELAHEGTPNKSTLRLVIAQLQRALEEQGGASAAAL